MSHQSTKQPTLSKNKRLNNTSHHYNHLFCSHKYCLHLLQQIKDSASVSQLKVTLSLCVRAKHIDTSCMFLLFNTVITQILTIAFCTSYRTFFSCHAVSYPCILLHCNYLTAAYQEVPLPRLTQFFLMCHQSHHTPPSCLALISSFPLSHSGTPDPVMVMSEAFL